MSNFVVRCATTSNGILRCAGRHVNANSNGLVFIRIIQCIPAAAAGGTCPPNERHAVHVAEGDDPSKDCAACRGETPPETP